MILSDALFYPYRSFKTQQVMTSQIMPHIEYLIQTYHIFCSFNSRNWWKSSKNSLF